MYHKSSLLQYTEIPSLRLSVTFVARFGFLLLVLVCPAPMFIFAFCCSSSPSAAFRFFSLPTDALSGFSLLLMSTTFHRSKVKVNK